MGDEEGIYEVEDLLEYKHIDGKDFYLVKWKGFKETSWEPDENIGQELAKLKVAAKGIRAGDNDRKRKDRDRDGGDRAERNEKKAKKEKKKRRRDSSEEERRKRGSDSDASGGEQPPG